MATYKIIGADGREYGPVSSSDLSDWIAQGRANAATRVSVEGSTTWTTLAEVPAFAADLARKYGTGSTHSIANGTSTEAMASDYLLRNRSFSVGSCLSRGWDLVRNNFWLTVGASVLVVLVVWAAGLIPIVGPLLLNYVLLGGLDWMFLKLLRGQKAEVADAFIGFGPMFVPLMLFSLVGQLLATVGYILCILPGIFVTIVWLIFPALLIIDKGMDFWPAMELSRKVAQRHFWGLLGLFLLSLLLLLAGTLLLVIGVFIAIPIVTAAFVVAYEDLFGAPSPALQGVAGPPVAPSPMEPPAAIGGFTAPTSPPVGGEPTEPPASQEPKPPEPTPPAPGPT